MSARERGEAQRPERELVSHVGQMQERQNQSRDRPRGGRDRQPDEVLARVLGVPMEQRVSDHVEPGETDGGTKQGK